MIIHPGTIIYDDKRQTYEVLEFINKGEFGYVYTIKRISDNSTYALKTLSSSFQDSDDFESFINEARLAPQIQHQNVIKYLFFHDGTLYKNLPPYIIMEFADQGTLKDLIDNQIKEIIFFSNDEIKKLYFQLIDGMEAVNSKLIHRDIKPDNILIKDYLLKISDFGISKVVEEKTRTFTFKGFGSVMYMPPEGWAMRKNSIQMDMYSMGLVFYEIATLLHPYSHLNLITLEEWKNAHFYQNPPNPKKVNDNLSSAIQQVILKMIDKSADKRFRSWDEIRKAIEKDEMPLTIDTELIDNMISKQIKKIEEIKSERLKREKAIKERDEFIKLIEYSINHNIIKPLSNYIKEFNSKFEQGGIIISDHSPFSFRAHLPAGDVIDIQFEPLFDENFYKEKELRGLRGQGRIIKVRELMRPKLYDRNILAWGHLKINSGAGLNLILLENDIYGEWFIMINKNTPGYASPRKPEPFAFDFNELEEEIKYVNSHHIYYSEIKNLDPKLLFGYIIQE